MTTKKTKAINALPWFKFWTGDFRSKTEHLSNAEVGAYVRLLASYWDNSGLPFNQRALTRIAKIEAGEDVDLGEIVAEFFIVNDGILRHEELDELRVDAIGEEDANRRRTLNARLALIGKRSSVTIPVTETEVEVDIEAEEEGEEDSEPEFRPRKQTHTQTEDPDSQADAHEEADPQPVAVYSGPQAPVPVVPARTHQNASIKPDGAAQGGAVPAVSSAQSGISFRLKDGSSISLSACVDESRLSPEATATLKQLAERFESIPATRVAAEQLSGDIGQWLRPSRKLA